MTREEEINNAVEEFKEERKTAIGRVKRKGWVFDGIFKEGIKWADNHPKSPWISVFDDLPCNHKELILDDTYTKDVLVIIQDNFKIDKSEIVITNMHNKIGPHNTGWEWKIGICWTLTHWMPIPELPKE